MKHYTKEFLEQEVKESVSIADLCRRIGIRPSGGNYTTLKVYLKKFGISTAHFTGQSWRKGCSIPIVKAKSLKDVLVENSYYNSNKLKKRLISEGFFQYQCSICLNSKWNNKPIPLELDHIDGVNTDNRIENLRVLCPNCHAQTPTFRGRNKLSALSEKREVEYRKLKEPSFNGNLEPSQEVKLLEGAETRHGRPKAIITKTCKCCGKLLTSNTRIYCSKECYKDTKSEMIPKVPEILKAFEEHKNFLQVGKHFNVSDNAVRKWCMKYGIMDMVKE